jgi:hypothetical protein
MEDFSTLSQSVIRTFVRSALIIDDRWPDQGLTSFEQDLGQEDLLAGVIPENESDTTEPTLTGEVARPLANDDTDAVLLDQLRQCLLNEGILACGLRYRQTDRNSAIALARRADIVVLDWHLIDDDGAEALEILRSLLGDCLRFVCIWTGRGRTEQVRVSLIQALGEATSGNDGHADLRIKNLVIAIRIKEGLEEEPGLTVGPEHLFEVAVQGLAKSYGGLVQLAMLEMTNQHREHLPDILEHIGSSLDTAVLLEAGDKDSPVGPGGAFLSVLVDEWRSRLERDVSRLKTLSIDGRVAFCARFPVTDIDAWQKQMREALRSLGYGQKEQSRCTPELMASFAQWLRNGCEGELPRVDGIPSKIAAWAALQSASNTEIGLNPLFRLDALFHQQLNAAVSLTQGTVVRITLNQTAHYLVCTTPACDAERPEKIGRLYTFVRTRIVPTAEFIRGVDGEFYCVLHDGENWTCLALLIKEKVSFEVTTPRFNERGIVMAGLLFGGSVPQTQNDNGAIELHRVAQLRAEHALSLTASAASDASRIGVNRVELIRDRFRKSNK